MTLSPMTWLKGVRRQTVRLQRTVIRRFISLTKKFSRQGDKKKNCLQLKPSNSVKKCFALNISSNQWVKRVLCLLAAFVLCGFLAVTGTIAYFLLSLRPQPAGAEREVIIPYATSTRELANQLRANGIIRNANGFFWYIRLTRQSSKLKAGVYRLSPGSTVGELLQQLRKGTPLSYRVTIPEGKTVREIAKILSAKKIVDSDEFLELVSDPEFLAQHLADYGKITTAEGFLFPDTYEFAHGVSEDEVLGVFFRRFKEVWREESRDYQGKRSPYQLLTMASIVEKEAKAAAERPMIAGVFYNRLSRRKPLESCATVLYALGRYKAKLYYRDLQIESEYNTYRYQGMPPGPISNPGRASIRAAIYPDEHSYLYFVAKPDGTHKFSTTYRQHLIAQKSLHNQSQ
jgi:UPF0755 protein